MTRQKIRYKSLVEALNRFVACVAGIKRGGVGEEEENSSNKMEDQGGGEKNACYKDPYWFISAVAGSRKILIG